MKRFRIIAAQEFKETLRSTPFRVITVAYAVLLLLALVAVGGLMLFEDSDAADAYSEYYATEDTGIKWLCEIAVDDRSGEALLPELEKTLPLVRFDKLELSDEIIESALEGDRCDACVIINTPLEFECYEKASLYDEGSAAMIAEALERIHSIRCLHERNVSGADVNLILDTRAAFTVHSVGGYNTGKYILNLGLVMLLFLVIALYGQMVSTRVATEKSSRTMEILATSVSPTELLCGKVVGVGLAGLMQLSIFAAASLILLRAVLSVSPQLAPLLSGVADVSVLDAVWLCLYFILGFLMIAFVYGGLGSMVSQVEDLSGLMSLPMYLFMAGYLISVTSSSIGESNLLLRIASFVPFWSPVVMFTRMSLETVPVWQIIVSLVLLALGSAITAMLSARLYRTGMLRYGKKPVLREIIDALKK